MKFSMTFNDCFTIPNISILFQGYPKQNLPWSPVEIPRNGKLFSYVEEIVCNHLLANKNLLMPLENLLEREIDVLPFSIISKKVEKSALIPIDFIEIEDIAFCKESRNPVIEKIRIGHYLAFYNQSLCEIDGKYVLDMNNCLIKNKKIITFINQLISEAGFQKRIRQVLDRKYGKSFYLGIEFKHQKSPLIFSYE
jgi:hypothetical protein